MKSFNDKAVILFDGLCNFCIFSIKFIIKRDTKGYFKFCSLQSDIANQMLDKLNYDYPKSESILLIQNGNIFNKSTAALKIFRHLKGIWPALYIFIVIPEFLRDGIYKFISRHRYKWFGKRHICYIPDKFIEKRFMRF